ncbi:MAG TPA: peroxiredoxin [Chloroflexi bacterium]|nr:peroxiredoxin [Chloroflexota bacterium]
MQERMSIIVFSGTVDKLLAVATLASGAAAMDLDVDIFLTFWGIEAFRKGNWKTNRRLTKDFEDYGPAVMNAMEAKRVPTWLDTLKTARELGNVNVYACSMTMELFGLTLEDMEDIVDDVEGVAGFIQQAKDSKITLFI